MPKPARLYSGKGLQFEFILLNIMILAALGLAGCGRQESQPAAPPVVKVAPVLQQDVPVYHEFVGITDGLVNAKVRAQVEGYLIKRNYKEGSYVKEGQVLFQIDPRPFEAALEQAKGQLAQDLGKYYTAKTTLQKVIPLAKLNAVSQQDRDSAIGQERAARAAVNASKAAVRRAEINLSFTKITSPINGIAGIANAQIGDLVGTASSPELTTVSTLNPIKVYIQLSEQRYLEHRQAMERHEARAPKAFVYTMILADGSHYPHQGKFSFLDRSVDVRTGTIKVAVLFPNPGNFLRPGQFARVRVLVDTQKNALLVPQKAVSERQGAFEVAVVTPDNTVDIRPVEVGERHGTLWVIRKGLQPGERVVVEGTQKVQAGEKVTPQPFEAEAPAKAKSPEDAGTSSSNPVKTSES
ncbi:MAG: efflux RND transporter periplasmic adaptor subunit [Syntrophobacterales bacterium]|jgi:membrane fusion protein (multidrug efflux system)